MRFDPLGEPVLGEPVTVSGLDGLAPRELLHVETAYFLILEDFEQHYSDGEIQVAWLTLDGTLLATTGIPNTPHSETLGGLASNQGAPAF